MRVLVTGGTGFIGHHLANELYGRGYKVTVLDKALNNYQFLHRNINVILGDICTDELSGKYDCVYHLAALRSVPDSFLHPEEYIATNVWGTFRLLKAFSDSRFVFASSSAAEEQRSVYGITKQAAEQGTLFHSNAVAVRLMNIFGERQTDVQMAFPAFCQALKNGSEVVIYGNTTRDYTYVRDVVDELIKIGESHLHKITDIGYGRPITILELYQMLARLFKKKENYIVSEFRHGDMLYTCATNIIDNPKYGLEKGIKRTVDWWKNERPCLLCER